MIAHVRAALRQYRRHPAFALTVVGTLALAIGATTAVFAVVNGVLVRALPFASPERLVWVASVRPDNPSAPFTLPEYLDYRDQTRTLSGLAAYANWSASLAGDGGTERLQGARMSANAFDVLGLRPSAGRLFTEIDDRADASGIVVLSHRLWQQRYGGNPSVVGTTARINGESFIIVGVLPPRFPLPLRGIDVVTPLVPDRDPLRQVRQSVNFLVFFGRLAPGVEASQAQAELSTICRTLRQLFPVEYARKESVRVTALQDVLVASYRQSMLALFAAVVAVLSTALANLVSLTLVRSTARHAELVTRLALGASRGQLARQLTIEALVLAVAGGGLGLIVAGQAIALAVQWAPPAIPRLSEVTIDGSVLLFMVLVTGLVTAMLAAAPLVAIGRSSAGDALRTASRAAIGSRVSRRVRGVMVVSEIAAAVVLVLGTLQLVLHLRGLERLDAGFRPMGVLQARISIPTTYRSPADVARFYDRLADRVGATPGVTQVGVTSVAPLSGLLLTTPFTVAGAPFEAAQRPSANLRQISEDYLAVVGSQVLRGRAFTERDQPDTPRVALVSAALADRFLPRGAIGQQLLINDNNEGPRPVEIVGVVENVRQAALDLPPAFDVYVPLRQAHADSVGQLRNNQFWMVKTASDPAAFRETFLAHLRAVDPDAAISDTGPMAQFVEASLGPRRFNLALLGAFALSAVLLAVIGLYGLISFAVGQRSTELGLRMALGATPHDVRRLVLRQAAGLGAAGATVGLALAAATRPIVAQLAQDTRPAWWAVAATTAALLGLVQLAAWIPARRASQIAPTAALRGQ